MTKSHVSGDHFRSLAERAAVPLAHSFVNLKEKGARGVVRNFDRYGGGVVFCVGPDVNVLSPCGRNATVVYLLVSGQRVLVRSETCCRQQMHVMHAFCHKRAIPAKIKLVPMSWVQKSWCGEAGFLSSFGSFWGCSFLDWFRHALASSWTWVSLREIVIPAPR